MNDNIENNDETKIILPGFLSEFREALEEEIDKIKKSGQSSTLLFSGRQIESHGTDLWYRFNVEYVPSLPADTPCKLLIGKDQFDVTVISFEENTIVISTKNPLPDTISKARLENGATVLMERLIKCIEDNAEKENPAGDRMISTENNFYSAKKLFDYNDLKLNPDNTPSQNIAITAALSNDITFIWGPPGTGKTTVIGQIIDELYKHDRSVLVVSHTNTAVDGAINQADKAYSKSNPANDTNYPVLRIGTPARPLSDRVLLSYHVASLGKELWEQKTAIEKVQAQLRSRINEIYPLIAKYNWIKESNLAEISITLQNLIAYEKEIAELQCRLDELNNSLEQEKYVHPEYADYLILSKSFDTQKRYYSFLCEQVNTTEQTVSGLPLRIQSAQDEIRKHARYTELIAQEEKCMSASFLQSEIAKADSQIIQIQDTITNLEALQTAAQQIITEYENKSPVAKFFAGRYELSHAKTSLERVKKNLPVAKTNLLRQQNLKQEYSQQFESLLLLQEQIRAVTPSETLEYWQNEVSKLQNELIDTQKTLSDLMVQKDSFYREICALEKQHNQAKVSFDIINEIGKIALQVKSKQSDIKVLRDKAYNTCTAQLEKEQSMCADFLYTSTNSDVSTIYEEISKLFASVKEEISSIYIDAIIKEKEDLHQQLIETFILLEELTEKMQELEKHAIMSAKIVGATLAKSYLSDTLRERKFDTVILDEASMASIPALWCASLISESSIVIVGDFLQLPPIVMADTTMAQKWLGKDIFYHSGMQERARNKTTCPDNFVMLNNQFRMESDIADIANMYYGAYGGLHSDDNNDSRVKKREAFYSWYPGKKSKNNVHLIDTENLHAWVTGVPQGKGHSRLNCFSAAVSVDLAFKLLDNKLKNLDHQTAKPQKEASVLIVAPYKPHITRINQLVELEYRNRGFKENLNFIRAGTIHSFQGSEADIVIFDLVIDEPHWKANLFMTDTDVNEGLRKMFNVAVTRAKFKLFIVGNFAYCQRKAKNNALSELLDKLITKDKLVKVDAKEILPDIVFSRQTDFSIEGNPTGNHIVCREESFNEYFMTDIMTFRKRLIIYSAFMTETRLSSYLPVFSDAIHSGKQIIVITKALSDRSKTELAQYQKCEEELRAIGVSVLHKKGMHEKLIFVDSDAVWIGSLNALSFSGLTGEVMQRHADQELTAEYEKLFDIEHICAAINNTYEQKCPICGEEMLVKESDDGGIYWQCVAGDYSRNATQQYPIDGILRCKCGAPYVFAMKNEPRWVCSDDPRHYQKMRESDLKLEKMAALIPTKTARKEVNKFFEKKKKAQTAKK